MVSLCQPDLELAPSLVRAADHLGLLPGPETAIFEC
jgi:hypothetical protein